MNVDWSPLQKSVDPLWRQVKLLFAEHHFLTILCAFFAVIMTMSFYRFLRSISPALVYFVLLLILAILVLHWTQTRTEPTFMKPFIDWLAPFFPDVSELPKAQATPRR
jgi:cell division protein FtsW (lipid II flippase)